MNAWMSIFIVISLLFMAKYYTLKYDYEYLKKEYSRVVIKYNRLLVENRENEQ